MRTITHVAVYPTLLPLTKTFTFASGSAGAAGERAPHVFVKITDSEGETGWGEARPVPGWSYETLETVVTTLRRYLIPAVAGLPITDRWDLHRRFHRAIGRGPGTGQPIARAALDTALHDLCARVAGLSLRSFLGGSEARNTIDLSFTLTAHEPSAVAEEVAAAREQGYRHFNFKAAVHPESDVAVADAIRQAAGSGAFVWADANQGFQIHHARLVADGFLQVGVDVLEQPLPADQLPQMRALRAGCQLPLAVDESAVGPTEFLHYVRESLVDYLVIKLTRNGGVWPTVQQIAIAEAAGLPLLVSGLTESMLAKVAVCQVASAFGFAGPAALNGSQFLDESALYPHKPDVERNGTVHLPATPGIGIHPDESALQDFLVKDLAV